MQKPTSEIGPICDPGTSSFSRVFVLPMWEPRISAVLNTCGVLRVLGTRKIPAVVNEEEIRHLATMTRAKLDLQPCAFISIRPEGED